MGRASLIQTNFTGGELAPDIALGRVDIAKYNNGARRIENCTITVAGGAKRRPGTRFVRATKDQTKVARLVEFVFNRGQAYVLEMGEGYVRFIKNRAHIMSGPTPYEVAAPYTQAQLPSVNYVQKSDTAFFAHEAVFPYRLQRFSDSQWSMVATPFITAPYEEQGHNPNTVLTLSQVNPGAATATSAISAFLVDSDVGRHLSYGGGYALITGVNSSTSINITIKTPFPSTVLPATGWNIEGSPQDSVAPSNKGRLGQIISLNANFQYFEPPVNLTGMIGAPGTAIITTGTAHGYNDNDTVQVNFGAGTVIGVILVVSPTVFGIAAPGLSTIIAGAGTTRRLQISVGQEIWRGADVGKYVTLNGGLIRITQVQSTSTAIGEVLRELGSDVPAGANAWTLESDAWNAKQGYPRAVTINKQRLMYAGSPGFPQNVWGSEIQGYLNFEIGTADDDGFRFELDGPRNSPILHLAGARQLLVLTEADEMSLKGGQEKPISPTNIQKNDESTAGASSVRPVKIGNETIFVQTAGKKVMAAGYRYDIDGFSSPNRTVFASHITGAGVVQMAHQKEPDSSLFAVRTDGQLAVCAYDIEQEVTGWARWITSGAYESVATVPTPTAEDTYAIVKRTIGGATKRYVEVFDADMLVDCGITGTNPAGQATWTGLDHLEGEMVQAWADGSYQGEYEVTAGQVTLPREAKSVQIGLGFTCLVEMLQPEIGGNGTTAQGSQVHVNEVIIRVLDTTAAVINGREIPFRRFGDDLLDLPPASYTGDVRLTTLSDQIYRTSQIITQPYPQPFHLLDVIRRVTINEG